MNLNEMFKSIILLKTSTWAVSHDVLFIMSKMAEGHLDFRQGPITSPQIDGCGLYLNVGAKHHKQSENIKGVRNVSYS